jgi:hypothetical protein
MPSRVCVVAVALWCMLAPVPARAQQTSAATATPQWLTVFLDCRAQGCDRNFFIQELPYVLWTQDRFDAEIHVLITQLETGSGGAGFTLELIGQQRFLGRADTLATTTAPNSTFDMQRRELTRVLKIGLGPYALRTTAGSRLALTYTAAAGDSSAGRGVKDPWNFWVYRASADGYGGAESQSTDYRIAGSLSAMRITEEWKIVFDSDYSYNALTFNPDVGPSQNFLNRQAEFEFALLRSITDHWSWGVGTGAEVDEFRNQKFVANAEIAAEYNFFPWKEATSRQLTAGFGLVAQRFDYRDTTIYGEISETRMAAKIQLASEVRQPWGSIFGGARHIRYLHDLNIYSAEVFAFMNFRISRGLSLNFGGSASKVNDQLYLPAGGLDPSEILTRQRALRTAYRLDLSAGFSFTFGSIFNTFVNPRFDNYN